jgi:hypothetical protein
MAEMIKVFELNQMLLNNGALLGEFLSRGPEMKPTYP